MNVFSASNPELKVIDTTVQQGNQAYFSIQMNNFKDLTALDFVIFYDSENFEFQNINKSTYLINDLGVTILENTKIVGQIRITLLSAEGFDYNGNIVNISLKTKDSISISSYPILLAIGEVYNANQDEIKVDGYPGYIHVIEKNEFKNSIYYYNSIQKSNLEYGETFNWTIYTYNTFNLTAGMYEILYDYNVVEPIKMSFGNGFNNGLTEINVNDPGRILFGFVSNSSITEGNPIISVDFRVIINEDISSKIEFVNRQIYDSNLEPIGGNNISRNININKVEVVEAKPKILLTSYTGKIIDEFEIKMIFEENSNVSSGDFTIEYDKTKVQFKELEILLDEVLIAYVHDAENARIKISLISSENISKYSEILSIKFSPLLETLYNTTINLSGKNIYDSNLNERNLDFNSSAIIFNAYEFQLGDLDQNNVISVKDLVLADLYLNGYITLTELQKLLLDIDENNLIDNDDYQKIIEIILN